MVRKRGRPNKSVIRQNLIEILYIQKKAYGYELYKYYCDIFPQVTMRVIYYHLRKGIATGEFEIQEIKQEEGNYSWGKSAEKIYYQIGKAAKPVGNTSVDNYFRKIK